MLVQLLAEAAHAGIEVAAQQEALHLSADRLHPLPEFVPWHRAVADLLPQREELLGRPHQVVAEAAARGAGAIDQGLEVALQVGPAPLEAAEGPVHPRPVA